MTETNAEIELGKPKFYFLENNSDEKKIQRWLYSDIKDAVSRLKELFKNTEVENLNLLCVDFSGKDWKITPASWASVAAAIAKGDEINADDANKSVKGAPKKS